MALLNAYISWSPLLRNKFPIPCIKVGIKQLIYHTHFKENVFTRPIQTERRIFKEAEVTFYTARYLLSQPWQKKKFVNGHCKFCN